MITINKVNKRKTMHPQQTPQATALSWKDDF